MTSLRVAAVQANYVLMDRAATLDRVSALTAEAAAQGAQLVAFPEVFVPGTPIWIDTRPIWDGDEDWFRLLAENAVVVPGPATERLGAIAREQRGLAGHRGRGTRAARGDHLQHRAVLLPRRRARRPAPQARADRRRSGRCGAWATGPRCAWWTRPSAGSAG